MNRNSTAAAVEDARRYLLLLLEEVWLSEAQSAEISRGIEAIKYLTDLDEPLAHGSSMVTHAIAYSGGIA